MARSKDFWNQVARTFHPQEVLLGPRQKLYCEREDSPLEWMRHDLDPGLELPRPPIAYFTGHRGSGKSNMLWRLLESFKDDYFIVYFDVEHNLDTARTNQVDVLYLLGTTIFEVALREGLEPDRTLIEELDEAVFSLTETHTQTPRRESVDIVKLASGLICFGAGALGGSVVEKTAEKLTKAVLEPFRFSSGVSQEIVRTRQVEPQVQAIINNVNLIIADVETRSGKDLFVVVDGLDKIQRLDQARLIFLESGALRGPVCRIVYTVPMLIYREGAFGQVEEESLSYLFPNVRTYYKTSGKRYAKGCGMLEEVVVRRLGTIGVELGDLFEPRALDLLIRKSGGVMRWLIELVRDAATAARIDGRDKISLAAARQAVQRHARRLAFRLDTALVDQLREIRRSRRLVQSDRMGELLQGLMVVAYLNGEPWFDAHPLVWEALEE